MQESHLDEGRSKVLSGAFHHLERHLEVGRIYLARTDQDLTQSVVLVVRAGKNDISFLEKDSYRDVVIGKVKDAFFT